MDESGRPVDGDRDDSETVLADFLSKTIETALSTVTGKILKTVDEKLSEAMKGTRSGEATDDNGSRPEGDMGTTATNTGMLSKTTVSIPSGGTLTDPALWSGVQVVTSSSPLTTVNSAGVAQGVTLTPATPLASVVKIPTSGHTSEAIIVGKNSPLFPKS